MLSPVDEGGVVTEADVVEEEVARDPAHVDAPFPPAEGVERRDRVVAVEPDVAREVVASAERHADERKVALEGHLRHLRERPVAAGHPERLGVGRTGEVRCVVTLAEDVDGHAAFLGGSDELIRARGVVARARIDEEETGYPAPFSESPSWRSSAPLGCAPSAAAAGSPSLKSTMVGIDAIP
jgi:hypothetical protein